jgi:cytochrome b involved in lipid metabolism
MKLAGFASFAQTEMIMKRLLLIAALLAAGVANAQSTTYTLADVAKHATAKDCWMVLNTTKVYNVTAFIPMHPGGQAMVPYCGKDGTQAFNGVPHSGNAVALEATYFIGNLTTTPLPISVQLAPTNATVNVGGTVHFTPTVTNSSAGVAWTLSPSSLGTISSSGLFTAVTTGGGTVTATSTQDMTKSASASVTVTATPPHTIVVTVTPSALSLNAGSKAQFTATLTNSTTQAVTWSTTGSIGTIDANGMFTAAPIAGTGMVKATSVEDPTKSHSVQVTVTAVQCRSGGDDDESHHQHKRGDD